MTLSAALLALALAASGAADPCPAPAVCPEGVTVAFRLTRSASGGKATATAPAPEPPSRGELTCTPDAKAFLRTEAPTEQWMIFEGPRVVVYYPKTREGLELLARKPQQIPVLHPLGLWHDPAFYLKASGMSPVVRQVREVWRPVEKTQAIQEVVVERDAAKRVTAIRYFDAKAAQRAELLFQDVAAFGEGLEAPRLIRSTNLREDGSRQVEETAIEALRCGAPPAADAFKLPPDAKLKTVRW